MSSDEVRTFAPAGIILSGGAESATVVEGPRAPDAIFELAVPLLGICYGMQAMAAQLGGEVASSTHREFGRALGACHVHDRFIMITLPEDGAAGSGDVARLGAAEAPR